MREGEDGIAVGEIIDRSEEVVGLRVCFFAGPEGNLVEIMEGWKDDENPPPAPRTISESLDCDGLPSL